jgi:hypothetical protein
MVTYKGGESKKTLTTFNQRKLYKENAKLGDQKLFDTWYENPLAMKLNENFEPVYLDPGVSGDGLASLSPVSYEVKVPAFVKTAFLDFREEYQEVVSNTNIGYPVFLDNLTPTKGHVRFDELYTAHVEYTTDYVVNIANNRAPISSYSEFENFVINQLLRGSVYKAITPSGFLLGNSCPVSVTGMCLELANLSYKKDRIKGDLLQDPSFECYLTFSTKNGFIPDKNAPWRLFVDLESPVMQKYITGPGEGRDYKDYLNRFHRSKPAFDDLYSMYDFMVIAYSKYLKISKREAITNWKNYGPPVDSMLDQLVRVRLLEVGASMVGVDEKVQKVLDYQDVYGTIYEQAGRDKYLPALNAIQNFCAEHHKLTFGNRNIDSYKPTTLKDYR